MPEERDNRALLLDAMKSQGFANYPLEWWHYTFLPEPYPDTYFDFPITPRGD
ncbi:MAG: M15 family metallopeptidase [Methyloceanibacter sp.]